MAASMFPKRLMKTLPFVRMCSCVRHRRRRRGTTTPSPLHSYPGIFGTYPDKLENIRANLKIKSGEILLKKHAIHLEIFCFENSADSFCSLKLFYSPTDMVYVFTS